MDPRRQTDRVLARQFDQRAFAAADRIAVRVTELAVEVIARMEEVLKSPPLLPEDPAKAREIYRWGLNYPDSGVENLFSDSELDQLIASKRKKIS